MAETLTPDLCVIGAGAGGLAVATAAVALGVPVVLVERGRIGGQRLNTGGVPSKALIAAARRAEAMRGGTRFGVKSPRSQIEFYEVNDHVHGVIGDAAPGVSKERLTGLGIRVIGGEGRFKDPTTVAVGEDIEVKARCFVIATGSAPEVPAIPGLDGTPFLTSETVFETRERPKHLIVLGGGGVALELAQAFRRLGSDVTLLDAAEPLAGEDPECARIVTEALARDGVAIRIGVTLARVRRLRSNVEVTLEGGETIEGSDLLIATGRRPNLETLGLDAARIKHTPAGITVDKRLRTSNKRVYAIGDAAGGPPFVHVATFHAGAVIRHALFRQSVKIDTEVMPRVVFTDPELAHVGLTEAQARQRRRRVRVLRWPYQQNDRALAERATAGHIKVTTDRGGNILGVTIVGSRAGELITAWTLGIDQGLNIRAFAGIVVPYPTFAEVGKRAANGFFAPKLKTLGLRRLLAVLRRLG